MEEIFDRYVKDELKLLKTNKIVLAISGGADSVAMLNLFSNTNYQCIIAHCNFHLRGAESDGDAIFVENLASKYNYSFYKTDFNTKLYAKENGISIEMAARELRYHWFEELRISLGFQFIATAHHQDDILETFLINFTRGTGIRGLSGIKNKKNNIIRPLLFTNRKLIIEYINSQKLEFRTDSTNLDTNIIRNKLRHQFIPLLDQINQGAHENMIKSIENLYYAESLMLKEIDRCKSYLGIIDDNNFKINIEKLREYNPVNAYLFELLRPCNFTNTQLKDIENALDSISGKTFYSKTHQLLKDRNDLIINQLCVSSLFKVKLSEKDENIILPENKKLLIQKIEKSVDFIIPKESNIAAIDMDKIKFPLLIRKWEPGDSFQPLGMKKWKKLSDFFIDEKLSLLDKQKVLLLISDNQIVWLIGLRIDNRFKITDNTRNILLLKQLSY